MLSRARELAPLGEPVEFVLADATVYPFAPANTDLLFSRFGVMFFAQPSVSFANMRKALRPDGRLAFACWRTPRDNPWMMLGLQEAYKHVPKLPEVKPEDPGPFAFASEERVHRILGEAGFMNIAMERVDLLLDIATGRGLEAAIESVLAIGPTSRALDGQPPDKIAAATESIRSMLRSHLNGNSVSLGGSIWIVTAVNGR
jgi:SAM-dependent methyltransferase